MSDGDLKRTPLHDEHQRLGARMGPFAGYAMPIQYSGILAEHEATRTAATIFDICHMGEFEISGPNAGRDLDGLLSCNIASLEEGRCRYGLLCNEDGGVLDDLIVYRHSRDRFMLVVNAGTRAKDFSWIADRISRNSVLVDISDETAKLDIQGPASAGALGGLVDGGISAMRYFSFRRGTIGGAPVIISRTGYTGELGFELYLPPASAPDVWKRALDAGVVPAGLGARDTLRLEMGMPLYGHELTESRNAGESGFTWAISNAKSFVGSGQIAGHRGVPRRLTGLRIEGRRAAREGAVVMDAESERVVGEVTSGSYGPSVGCAIALAYVESALAGAGTRLRIKTARAVLPCDVVDLPFYAGGTARADMEDMLDG